MKQFPTALFIVLFLLPATLLAQDLSNKKNKKNLNDPYREQIIQPSIILGFNSTQIDGDNLSGFRKFGANAGGGAFIMLPKNFSVNFEILYSMKGSKSSKSEAARYNGDYKLILDYIDIPIGFNYHDKERAIFGLGVIVNNLVRYEETFGDTKLDSDYKRLGVEVMANLSFLIKRHYCINFRYQYSITQINNGTTATNPFNQGTQRSNILTMRFMYIFR